MKPKVTIWAVFFFISLFAYTQQTELRGIVSVHNSKYETGTIRYIKDALINAAFAKPATSDTAGRFILEFVGVAAGTSVRLTLEKQGLEVVNPRDLENVVIGRKLPVRVFVAEKGKLAQAQTELYNISRKALFSKKDSLIAQLRSGKEARKKTIAELEKRFRQKLTDRYEAENLLNKHIADLERRLPEFARELAEQNLDFASDLYIAAYKQFKKGNIEKTIALLDNELLEASYSKTRKNIREGKKMEHAGKQLQNKSLKQITQLINSYQLKIKLLYSKFKYGQVAGLYKKILETHSIYSLDTMRLIDCYFGLASAYFDDGRYIKALEFSQKALQIKEKKLDSNSSKDLTASYNQMGKIHTALGNYGTALSYHQKSMGMLQSDTDKLHADLTRTYTDIGNTYIHLKKYRKALRYYKKNKAILTERANPDLLSLAQVYGGIGKAYKNIGRYRKAFFYVQKAISIQQDRLVPKHPFLATSYHIMGMVYLARKKYRKALQYLEQTIRIRGEVLHSSHPDLASAYITLAKVYVKKKQSDNALKYQKKAWEIFEDRLPKNHPKRRNALNTLIRIQKQLKDENN
ncbi:MAG: tetratricopeptide repeat protein [Flavobacteriaceae bacterium]|nr:MAG: tetratricopeptide repeat protein [Flavobacteriaceae bacterium]